MTSLIEGFVATRAALLRAASGVPAHLRDSPFVGHWDVKDVLAHTAGWDYTNIEALPELASGRLPAFFDRYDPDWTAINAELVARYRVEDWDALLESLRASLLAFTEAILAVDGEAFENVIPWRGRRVSVTGLLRAAARDEAEHVRQIEAFLSATR